MKFAPKKLIRIAVVENDPLRFVGFRALFDGDSGFVLQSNTPSSIFNARGYDLVLIGAHTGSTMYQIMAGLKSHLDALVNGTVPGPTSGVPGPGPAFKFGWHMGERFGGSPTAGAADARFPTA